MRSARVILRPGPGESAADLCRDLLAITNGSGLTVRSFAGGFLVDDKTALTYLGFAAEPDGDPSGPAPTQPPAAPTPATPPAPPVPPAPQAEPGSTAPTSTTTNPDGDTPTAKPRRVPRRGAAMKGPADAV